MAFMASMTSQAAAAPEDAHDPYLWLEDVTGDEALDWVRAQNEPTLAALRDEEFERMRAEALEVLDTDARIPYGVRRGEYLYNFWRDAANPRGLWRRTTLDSYRSDSPDWDVLIDIDELGRADDANWVWAGAGVIEPEYTRALVALSRGGSDASVVREFDMATREFVDDGFALPEAKSQLAWVDIDTVLVGTDFGDGSLTDSGYPRVIKRWRRGTPLSEAQTVFEGARTDVRVSASVDRTPGFERTLLGRALDFWNEEVYELRGLPEGGPELIRIDAPTDASLSIHREWLLIELRTDWFYGANSYPAGSLLAVEYEAFLSGTTELSVVFEPDEHTALNHYAWTRDRLLMVTLADVASRVEIVTPGEWRREPVPGIPEATNTVVVAADDTGDEFFLDSSGFVTPSRLMRGTGAGPLDQVKSAPAFFDAENMTVAQYFVPSQDGTPIPYFVVRPAGARGPGPTMLYGYGGFESANTPAYSGVLGRLWLARGGTYVLANIRGGGEYGPGWHTQAMREGRHKVAEDFAAVATDLVNRGITTVDRLGAQGGSNGGPADGHHADPVPGALRRAGLQRAAAGHEALPPAARGRLVDGRIRRPGQSGRLGVHLRILALPEHFGHAALPAGADDHVHPRRSGASRARPQDDGGAAGRRAPGLLLREHRGRARGRRRQPAGRVQGGADLLVPVADAGGVIGSSTCQRPNASNSPCWRPG